VIDAKIAAQKAMNYLTDLLGEQKDLALEEVELDPHEQYWLVTLGYNIYRSESDPTLSALTGSRRWFRVYKVFRVGAEDGEVRSMKIRETP
jgi:hypothetical protein